MVEGPKEEETANIGHLQEPTLKAVFLRNNNHGRRAPKKKKRGPCDSARNFFTIKPKASKSLFQPFKGAEINPESLIADR